MNYPDAKATVIRSIVECFNIWAKLLKGEKNTHANIPNVEFAPQDMQVKLPDMGNTIAGCVMLKSELTSWR